MKLKKAFAWFLAIVMLFSMLGAFPASAHAGVSPLLHKGPRAVLANKTSKAKPGYDLFTCQLNLEQDTNCYDPYEMRTAYNTDKLISAGYTGKGSTIVIVDAYQSPRIVDQLNYFDSYYGLPGLNGLGAAPKATLGTFTQVAPDGLTPFDDTDGNMIGWAEEISLDVEWAHAIAPGANITLVLAKTNEDADLYSATKYAVDNNLGDVISQSFGEDESCVDSNLLKQEHALFAQATNKHITLLASSGDDGASQLTCDGSTYHKAASSPASDPLVTGVGGTELHAMYYCFAELGCEPTANPAPGTYQDEVAWNETMYDEDAQLPYSIATGGGYSVLYKAPYFQTVAVKGAKGRGVPDVSYNAAVYHGVLTYLDIPGISAEDGNQQFWLFGGTSAGSPQWAAIVAIADQKAGKRLGFLNQALYLYALNPQKYASQFHDVTSGNNTVVNFDASNPPNPTYVKGFNATKGWDATTGLGSPKVDGLVAFLTRYTSTYADGTKAIKGSDPANIGRSGPHQMGH
jgi:subtilase family serine protease